MADGVSWPSRSARDDRARRAPGAVTTPVVVVAGPTASGKSTLALALAERFDGVVVNADSMQLYRELDILTDRPGRAALDGALESYRYGVQQGAIPPDFIVEKSLAVVEAFIEPAADQNAMYLSFTDRLEQAGIEDAERYTDRALKIIDADVIPAYQRIADYMGEIKASAPHDAGVWRLPNGEALYAAMIRHMTDSNLSADEVHQTGLSEVDRITKEMDDSMITATAANQVKSCRLNRATCALNESRLWATLNV